MTVQQQKIDTKFPISFRNESELNPDITTLLVAIVNEYNTFEHKEQFTSFQKHVITVYEQIIEDFKNNDYRELKKDVIFKLHMDEILNFCKEGFDPYFNKIYDAYKNMSKELDLLLYKLDLKYRQKITGYYVNAKRNRVSEREKSIPFNFYIDTYTTNFCELILRYEINGELIIDINVDIQFQEIMTLEHSNELLRIIFKNIPDYLENRISFKINTAENYCQNTYNLRLEKAKNIRNYSLIRIDSEYIQNLTRPKAPLIDRFLKNTGLEYILKEPE